MTGCGKALEKSCSNYFSCQELKKTIILSKHDELLGATVVGEEDATSLMHHCQSLVLAWIDMLGRCYVAKTGSVVQLSFFKSRN